jgi:hypothetical protein
VSRDDKRALSSIPPERVKIGGIYRHYKGDLYTVLEVGRLSEERTKWMVIYRSHLLGFVWIRPMAMFCEYVPWPDGRLRQRFELIEEGG